MHWMFRDRQTGRTVIAQRPKIPLLHWLVAITVSWFLHGIAHTVVSSVGTIARVIGATEEIVRGVNPWRRTLGAAVLVALVVTWVGYAV